MSDLSVIDTTLVGVLLVWSAVLIARQFRNHIGLAVLNSDPYAIIPEWSLFAPVPIAYDLHLVVRTFDGNETATDWCEVRGPQANRWFHCAYFPAARSDKAMYEICNDLITFVNDHPNNMLDDFIPYRLLEELVLSFVDEHAHFYQFAVMRTKRIDEIGDDFSVAFASNITRMDR